MGPAKEQHEQEMVLNHVAQLAGLRAACNTNKENINEVKVEVCGMNTRLNLAEQNITVLRVKFAAYSAIAVFVANIIYTAVGKLLGM